MRALTLKPWWAHAVAHHGKRIENRTRPIPPALVGQRIAIHAGAAQWGEEDLCAWRACAPPTAGTLDAAFVRAARRCIVATAVLGACVDAAQLSQSDDPQPPWAMPSAPYWWRLEEVITLRDPVPVARGQLGLWRMDADTIAAVISAGGVP